VVGAIALSHGTSFVTSIQTGHVCSHGLPFRGVLLEGPRRRSESIVASCGRRSSGRPCRTRTSRAEMPPSLTPNHLRL